MKIVTVVTVVATFQARPGKEIELRNVLVGLVAPTRREEGCINYDLHVSPEDPAKFLFHENWTGKAALDVHLKSPHIAALLPRVDELCVAFPEIKIWEQIA
ncbi:MAG: putative quinol monooxygenase [Verrucomicrobiales bacterium]|nr:putative quinol monooxygenase [Verrucomicrobiales bacterium]